MAVILGVDVSAYQTVTYATAAKHIGFLIAKATEGAHTTSSAWSKHWTGARVAGILRGSYHLCHPSQNPTNAAPEADHYIAVLRSAGFVSGRDLPPVLDIEPGHGLSKAAMTTWAIDFMRRVDASFGLTNPWLRTGVYVGDSIRTTVDVAAITSGRWFWRGTYGTVVSNGQLVPAGCSIAQWVTPASQVPGITGSALDRDVARPEDLHRMAPAYFATTEEDMPLTDADATKVAKAVLTYAGIQNRNDPSGASTGMQSLASAITNIEATQDVDHGLTRAVTAQLGALKGSLDAVTAALAKLATADQPVDVDALVLAVRGAAEAGAESALSKHVNVDVTFTNESQPPA